MLPYQLESDTSLAAAVAYSSLAKTARERVFRLICRSNRGLTDEDIQQALNMNPSTQRPRRVELVGEGLIQDTGRRRHTKSGMEAVVWAQVPGKEYPSRWPSPKVKSETGDLEGDAKAIAEIEEAVPEKRRSRELKVLLERLKQDEPSPVTDEDNDPEWM